MTQSSSHPAHHPSPRHCPKCRVAVDPSDHFCRACGADLTQATAPAAPRAGDVASHGVPRNAAHAASHRAVHGSARSEKSVDRLRSHAKPTSDDALEITSFDAPHSTRPAQDLASSQKRRPRRWIVGVVLTMAAVALVIALGIRWNRPTDEPSSKSKGPTYVAGPELRTLPAETVADPTGARVRVPERKAADLGKLFWRAVATPPELKELPLDGPVRRFDSADNLTIRGKTMIELPCETADAVVLARGTLGLWIPLPSEAITSDDGRSARRVVIDSEPTPWLFALTTDPEAARPPNDALMAEIVRFEQRHWTSKTLADDELAPTRPKTASAERRASGPAFVGVANAQETWRADEVKGTVALAWHTLRRISSTFHDEATLQRMRMDGNDPMAWAWQEYRTGIGLLSELRKVPRGTLESVRFADARPILGGPVSADPWSAETADSARPPTSSQADEFREASSRRSALFLIETLAADYAPWGIETVKAMIDSSPSGGPLFDLRVLTPVGNLNFVDMELPEKTELPGAVETDLRNLPRSPLTGVERKLALRLYSSRAVNLDWYRWFLDLTDDGVLRWGPVLYGAARFAGYVAFGAALTNPVSELGWFAWSVGSAVLEQSADWYLKTIRADGDVYTLAEYAETLTLDGAETAARTLATLEPGNTLRMGKLRLKSTPAELQSNLAMLMASLSVAYLLQDADMGLLKAAGEIPTGRVGYGGNNVPPIVLLATLSGSPLDPPTFDRYETSFHHTARFSLDYASLYPADLSASLGGAGASVADARPFVASLPLVPHRPTGKTAWRVCIDDKTPNDQLLRFALPRTVIERQMVEQGISDTAWDQVETGRLNLYASVASRDGAVHFVRPLEEVTNERDRAQEERSFAVRIHKSDQQLAPLTNIDKDYRATAFAIARPRATMRLAVVVARSDDAARTAEPITVPLDATITPAFGAKSKVGEFKEVFGADMRQVWIYHDVGPLSPALGTPTLTVDPGDLSRGLANVPYTFDAALRNASAGDSEIRFEVRYPDGVRAQETRPAPAGSARAKFARSFPKGMKGEIEFEARSTKTARVVASARVPLAIGEGDGQWHLAGVTTEDVVPHMDGKPMPRSTESEGFSDLVFESNAVSARFFSKTIDPQLGAVEYQFRGEWGPFPPEVKPGQKLRVPITISRTWIKQPSKPISAGFIDCGERFDKVGSHEFVKEVRSGVPGERMKFTLDAVPLNHFWHNRRHHVTYIFGDVSLPDPAQSPPMGMNPLGGAQPPTPKKP